MNRILLTLAATLCLSAAANAQQLQRANYNDGKIIAFIEQTTSTASGQRKKGDRLVIKNISNSTVIVDYQYKALRYDMNDNYQTEEVSHKTTLPIQPGQQWHEAGYISYNHLRGYYFVDAFAILNVSGGNAPVQSTDNTPPSNSNPVVSQNNDGSQRIVVTIDIPAQNQQAASGNYSTQSQPNTSVNLAAINIKYTEAAEAVIAKNFAYAIPLFEQVIREGRSISGAEDVVAGAQQALPAAVFQSGGSAFQSGRFDEALAAFSKAAQLSELYGNISVLNNARTWIGRVVMRQGADAFNAKDYATAAAIFKKGYDANPNDTTLAMNLALCYSGLKEFDKSIPIYRRIIAIGNSDSRFAADAAKAQESLSLDLLEQSARGY